MPLAHHLEFPYFEVVIERSAIASQRVSGAIDPTLDLLLCKWVSYFSNTDAGGQHIEGDLVLELMCRQELLQVQWRVRVTRNLKTCVNAKMKTREHAITFIHPDVNVDPLDREITD